MGRKREFLDGQSSVEILRVKRAVRERDGHRCTKCGMTAEEHERRYGRTLDVHRLMPGSLYSVEGCVSFCRPCHGPEPKRPRGAPDLATDKAPVRLPRELFRKMKVIAAHRRIRLADYFLQLITPVLLEEEAALFGDARQ
jgi:5-methylcytosine-specific restriction endonuclease McrA